MVLPAPIVRLTLPEKRVCFWGAPAGPDPHLNDAALWRVRLEQTGGNTGNLFIGHALFEGTEALEKRYHPGFSELPADGFDDKFDYLFIPASNFINPALDLQPIYDYFRRTKVPIFCFG